MRINFEDDFIDMGNELSNGQFRNEEPLNGVDFLTLEKVIFRVIKLENRSSFPYVVCILPLADNGQEKCLYLNFFNVEKELYHANRIKIDRDKIICLASCESSEEFIIKDEIEYRKLLKITKETNNSVKLWFEYLPFESGKLININKKFDDLFAKKISNPSDAPDSEIVYKNQENDHVHLDTASQNVEPKESGTIPKMISSINQQNISKNECPGFNLHVSVPNILPVLNQILPYKNFSSMPIKPPIIHRAQKPISNQVSPCPAMSLRPVRLPNEINSLIQEQPNPNEGKKKSSLILDIQSNKSQEDQPQSSDIKKPSNEKTLDEKTKDWLKNITNITALLDEKMAKLNNKIDNIESKLFNNKTTKSELTNDALEDKKDLVEHSNIYCDSCDKYIFGVRFKCISCLDYDLCEKCEKIDGVHIKEHNFIKIKTPIEMATLASAVFSYSSYLRPKQNCLKIEKELKKKHDDQQDSSEFVKKKKRKSNSDGNTSKLSLVKSIDQENKAKQLVEIKELNSDEKLFNKIKEMHDNLLIEFEPSFQRKTAYYVESFKTLSKFLINNIPEDEKNQKEDFEKQVNRLSKLNLKSPPFAKIVLIEEKLNKLNELKSKLIKETSKIKSITIEKPAPSLDLNETTSKSIQSDKMAPLLSLSQSEQNCKDFLGSYISFVKKLSGNKEFLSSYEHSWQEDPEKEKACQKALIEKVNKAFFGKFMLISNVQNIDKQVDEPSRQSNNVELTTGDGNFKVIRAEDVEEKQICLEKNSPNAFFYDLPMSKYPNFLEIFQKQYFNYLSMIYKSKEIKDVDQLIKDFQKNLKIFANEDIKKEVTHKYLKSTYFAEIYVHDLILNALLFSLDIHSDFYSQLSKLKDKILLPNLAVKEIADFRTEMELANVKNEKEEKVKKQQETKEIEVVYVNLKKLNIKDNENKNIDEKKDNEYVKEDKNKQDEHKESKNEEQFEKESEKEDLEKLKTQSLANCSNISWISNASANFSDSFSVNSESISADKIIIKKIETNSDDLEKQFSDVENHKTSFDNESNEEKSFELNDELKNHHLDKKPDEFVNIALESDTRFYLTPLTTSSTCSLNSYEMVMSDSFDFDKINNEIGLSTENIQSINDDQILVSMKNSTTQLSVDSRDLHTSTSQSIYKSSLEANQSEEGGVDETNQPEEAGVDETNQPEEAGVDKKDLHPPKIKNVFDFNNWTYLLSPSFQNTNQSSKSTETYMNEFYEICKKEYGLKNNLT